MKEKELNLFNFGNDDNGNYVDFAEEERKRIEENRKEYPFEDLIKGNEDSADYKIVASWFCNSICQWGKTLAEIQKEISNIVKTKCYHYGNMNKGIYVYTYKVEYDSGETAYKLMIITPKNIVGVNYTIDDLDGLLDGEIKISYPACCVDIFDTKGNNIGLFDENHNDRRHDILIGDLKLNEFSDNRLEKNKKPNDFYECEFALTDFIKYWGD